MGILLLVSALACLLLGVMLLSLGGFTLSLMPFAAMTLILIAATQREGGG